MESATPHSNETFRSLRPSFELREIAASLRRWVRDGQRKAPNLARGSRSFSRPNRHRQSDPPRYGALDDFRVLWQSQWMTRTIWLVEVCGSSPHGPTIFFSELASATLLGKAPNGSIKELVRDSQGSIRLWAQDR